MSAFPLTRRRFLGAFPGSLASVSGRSVDGGSTGSAVLAGSPTVDIHCHTFCTADLPIVGFLAHHVPGLPEISRFLTRWPETAVRALVALATKLPNAATPTGGEELATLRAALANPAGARIAGVVALPRKVIEDLIDSFARKLPFSLDKLSQKAVARYLDTLYLAAHSRAAIAATLASAYGDVQLFTPMLVDYDAWSDDQAPTPLATQILIQEAIAGLSCAGRIGRADARLHPFVAFDPRRQAACAKVAPVGGAEPLTTPSTPATPATSSSPLEMVKYAVKRAGFLGVKLYPPVGFAPADNARLRAGEPYATGVDDALDALYRLCVTEEISLTTHTSAANEYAFGLHEMASPLRWSSVLAKYPGLRLNFAHFGHDYGVEGKDTSRSWLEHAAALMEKHESVYADLSNSPLAYDVHYAVRFLELLMKIATRFPKVKKRIMFGSDWWLANIESEADLVVARFRGVFSTVLTAEESADLMGRNALRFLGLLDDDNRPRRGLAAVRLREFYGPNPLPFWLPS